MSAAINEKNVSDEDITNALTQIGYINQRHGFEDEGEKAFQKILDAKEPLYIMIIGEGKFGKSSLINNLTGKNIAPVSRIPKTWKVDIYEPSKQETALMYYKDNPEVFIEKSIGEAYEICKLEEGKLKSGYKSDLFQVKWKVNINWPKGNCVIIDTPGFSQLREKISGDIRIYSGDGIQFKPDESFDFYYYRADVVLWCLKATKLEDRDTLDTLIKVSKTTEKKSIIGVITFSDRIPNEKLSVIMSTAKELYGEYINEFIFSKENEDAANEIKGLLDEQYLNNPGIKKKKALEQYTENAAKVLNLKLKEIASCFLKNIDIHNRCVEDIRNKIDTSKNNKSEEVEKFWLSEKKIAITKLEKFWNRCNDDENEFRNLVNEETFDPKFQNLTVSNIRNEMALETNFTINRIFDNTKWIGLKLEAGNGVLFEKSITNSLAINVNYTVKGDAKVTFSGDEGIVGSVGVGAGAAAVGMLMLGPIGIVAGAIGFLFKSLLKKNSCISKASDQIQNYIKQNQKETMDGIKSYLDNVESNAIDTANQSYGDFFKLDLKDTFEAILKIDLSFNEIEKLNLIPCSSSNSLFPSEMINSRVSSIESRCHHNKSYYYYTMCKSNSTADVAQKWDKMIENELSYKMNQMFSSKNLPHQQKCFNKYIDKTIHLVKQQYYNETLNDFSDNPEKRKVNYNFNQLDIIDPFGLKKFWCEKSTLIIISKEDQYLYGLKYVNGNSVAKEIIGYVNDYKCVIDSINLVDLKLSFMRRGVLDQGISYIEETLKNYIDLCMEQILSALKSNKILTKKIGGV